MYNICIVKGGRFFFFLFSFKHKYCHFTGFLVSLILIMKSDALYMQVIGWSMWFSEYLFLERSWAKDESTIKVMVNVSYIHAHSCTHNNRDIHGHVCIFPLR